MRSPAKKSESLWAKFKNRAFRESYVESHASSNIANQIATMREERGWTQAELAARSGLRQSQISTLENPSQKIPSLKMILKVAAALDVAIAARFVRYSDVVRWAAEPSMEKICPPPFRDDRLSNTREAAGASGHVRQYGAAAATETIEFDVESNSKPRITSTASAQETSNVRH